MFGLAALFEIAGCFAFWAWLRALFAERPKQLRVADFTYVATWRGTVYVAIVLDVFSRRIVGWRAHATMKTALVLDALEQALYDPELEGARGALVVRSYRASQYVSTRYNRAPDSGRGGSVGRERRRRVRQRVGESVIGLNKTEVIRRRGLWRSFDDAEFATLEDVPVAFGSLLPPRYP